MDSDKGAGPDGIHSKLMKMCAKDLTKLLSIIFNISFLTGSIPKKMEIG